MKAQRTLFYTLCLFLVVLHAFDMRPKTSSIGRLLGKCRKYPKATTFLDRIQYSTDSRAVRLNLRLNVLQDLDGTNFHMKFLLQRCQSKEALSTCETMPALNLNSNLCEYLSMDTYFTPAIKAFNPPLKCPVKKGIYVMTNGTLNAEAINMFPVDNYYWKWEWQILNAADKVIFCLYSEGKIVYAKE